jgi:uncharacterized protein YbjT (DUF2867 family)
MKVILFGASGMVGQAVLRECLRDPSVERVLSIGRSRTGAADPKLEEIVHNDLWQYGSIEPRLAGYDACFFCLGISSGDVSADEYEHITYGITLAAAETLARLNPQMTFVYVSGAGTDSSESGRVRWARVKGRTENALLRLPLRAYMFRPGVIQPLDGIQSRTRSYRLLYAITGPVLPLLRRMFPNSVLTTREIGRAMIAAARNGAPKHILESRDIRELGR